METRHACGPATSPAIRLAVSLGYLKILMLPRDPERPARQVVPVQKLEAHFGISRHTPQSNTESAEVDSQSYTSHSGGAESTLWRLLGNDSISKETIS